MKKRLLAIVIAVVMILALAACGGKKGSDPIVGKWSLKAMVLYGEEISVKDVEEMGMDVGEMSFEFKDNGDMIGLANGSKGEGTWEANGDKYKLTIDGVSQEAWIESGDLHIDISGFEFIFED